MACIHSSPDPSPFLESGSGSQDLFFPTPIIQSVTGMFPCNWQCRNMVAQKTDAGMATRAIVTSMSLVLR